MATKKSAPPKAAQKAAPKAAPKAAQKAAPKAPQRAAPKAPQKAPGARAAAKSKAPADALDELAAKLGLTRAEAEERAIAALATRGSTPKGRATREPGPLPERLFLLLDGRGLDGRGMGIEVIDLPTILGSEKHCTVWINSPQIETRHLQIWREGESWLLEDLGTEKGTWLGDQRIKRRRIEHGDEFRLAGYLRLRTEFR